MAAFPSTPALPAPASDVPGTRPGAAERACAALLAPLVAIGLAALARSLSLFLRLMEEWRAGTLQPTPTPLPALSRPDQPAVPTIPAARSKSRFAWILDLFRRSPPPALARQPRTRATAASPRVRVTTPRAARTSWVIESRTSASETAPVATAALQRTASVIPWRATPSWPTVPCLRRWRPAPYARAGPPPGPTPTPVGRPAPIRPTPHPHPNMRTPPSHRDGGAQAAYPRPASVIR